MFKVKGYGKIAQKAHCFMSFMSAAFEIGGHWLNLGL
jgi:hypothetical protein